LLPDNALSARFTTTAGPDLKQVSGTIYVGSHEGTNGEQRVLWVKVWDRMYPTGEYHGFDGNWWHEIDIG
jgi:translation initiation factor 2D